MERTSAFTLDTYAHLLDAGIGEGRDLDSELVQNADGVAEASRSGRLHLKRHKEDATLAP